MTTQLPTETPAFTVSRALCWLGHDCARHCSAPLDDLPAAIWFVRRANADQPRRTIIVVDPAGSDEPVLRIRHLIRDINLCTRGDGIYVLARLFADIGNALSIVSYERAGSHAR